MSARLLPLLALLACGPVKVPGQDDSAVADDSAPQPDACDDHAGELICQEGAAITCDQAGDVASSATCAVGDELCLDGQGCATCGPGLDLLYADDALEATDGGALIVDEDPVTPETFGWQRYHMRPLVVSGEPALPGDYTLSAGAGLELYTEDGEALSLPLSIPAANLPRTLLVRATAPGAHTLSAAYAGDATCTAGDTVVLRGVDDMSLTGAPRSVAPFWESADTFHEADAVTVALDPYRHRERVGLEFDAYIVPHRSPDEWAADPALSDASGGAETLTLAAGDISGDTWTLSDGALHVGDGLGQPYDVVLDFGRDGQLDPGDLIDGLDPERAGFYVLGDLSAAGPHAIESFDDTGGYFLGQRVYYPADIADMGELPLVVISHGNGHDYTWYDYLGDHLASWGYVVMAHQNDTGPGIETASETTIDNTDYLLSNLDSFGGGVLYGHVDPHTIVWIGHSRGGEGVVRAYDRLIKGDFTPSSYTWEDIQLISSIAPTVFNRVTESNPHDITYHLIAGSADGDVTGGVDCEQCQFFRISEAALGPVQVTYVHGAAHNDFNCCGFSDGTGPDQIGRDEAQTIAKAYFLALIQTWIDGNPATRDYFTRMPDHFRPPELAEADVIASTYHDAHYYGYPILDDFQSEDDDEVMSSGGTIDYDVDNVSEDALNDGDNSFAPNPDDPMNGMSRAVLSTDEARGVMFDFKSASSWAMSVPVELSDFSDYAVLSFAVCQGSRHPLTVDLAGPLDFTVTLRDGAGVESGLDFLDQGVVPEPYQRDGVGSGQGWANELVTVRIPLTDFEIGSDIDLSDIQEVRFDFGGDDGTSEGRLGLDDVELSQ